MARLTKQLQITWISCVKAYRITKKLKEYRQTLPKRRTKRGEDSQEKGVQVIEPVYSSI